jgi:hypothetical protein
LPNKIFDYARMGLPFVTLGNPEVKVILDKYPMGWIIPSLESNVLSSAIVDCLREIPSSSANFSAARKSFFMDNNAMKEWKLLETIVE